MKRPWQQCSTRDSLFRWSFEICSPLVVSPGILIFIKITALKGPLQIYHKIHFPVGNFKIPPPLKKIKKVLINKLSQSYFFLIKVIALKRPFQWYKTHFPTEHFKVGPFFSPAESNFNKINLISIPGQESFFFFPK